MLTNLTARAIIILLSFSVCFPAIADVNNHNDNSNAQFINVIHYDQFQGLLGEKVTQMDQDHLGYMWFATHQGLNRFDSQTFHHFKQDSLDAGSLPSNEISLFVQSEHDMWLSLNNIGLARYKKDSNEFALIPQIDLKGDDQSHGIFHSMIFALANDDVGNTWVFQFDAGISIFNQQSQRFSHLTQENTEWLQSVRFFDAQTDDDGHIWVATLEGIVYEIDPNSQQAVIHHIEVADKSAKEARIYSIGISQDGTVYLGAYQGVYRFDSQQKQFSQIISREHINQLMGEPLSIRNIMSDSDGRLWLSTIKGLLLFNQGLLSHIKFINQGEVMDDHINIRSVYEDKERNIWVATDNRGVLRLNHHWDQTTIKRPFTNAKKLNISEALHSEGHFEDNIWLYDNQQHVLSLNLYKNGRLTTLKTYDAENNLPDQVNGLFVDRNFNLWVPSVMGLYRLNNNTLQFDLMSEMTGIMALFEIKGQLYLTAYGDNQLYRWNYQQNSVEPLPQTHLNEISTNLIEDNAGRLWMTGNNGLEVMDVNTFETLFEIPSEEGFLNVILDEDKVWLLSNGKVLRYRQQDGELINESTSQLNQLISTYGVYHFHIFNQQLWLISQEGVLVVDPSDNRLIKRYSNTDDLPGRLAIDLLKMHDGGVIIVTDNGLAQIKNQPQSTETNIKSTLVLEQLRHNGQQISDLTALPYNYGSLQVDYQLLSFSRPDSHRYQYRLQSNQDWLDSGHQTSQNFYQLPADNYQLQIRGKTLEQDWSDPLTITFHVAKEPWKTATAYWIYGLLSLLLLLTLFLIWRKRWQYNQELRFAHEKQAFVENQLSLTSSLVQSLDVDELFAKIKHQIGKHIICDAIEVCYWNNDNNDQVFSDDKLTVSEQNRLGSVALKLHETDQKYMLESIQDGEHLRVLFSHSENRLGLVSFHRQSESFKANTISLAIAYVAQASLAIENARLFQAVQHLAEQANTSSQAKSDFLAQVSHEIRTPMNGILGMNQLLLDSPLNEDQRLYADAVNESGEHLLAIINDILDLSKIEAGKLVLEQRPFNLVELADEVTQSFISVSKNKRLDFVTCLDAELNANCIGDATRIKQIIINLLSNAFKFTQSGEVLLSILPADNPDELLIVVKDTGMGIAQSMINNLFDPFAQADSSITRKYGGTGLGLSIVKQLCEKMAGDINIESHPGQGTEVSCLIKVGRDHSPQSTPQVRHATAGLMAEDSMVKSALSESLLRLGMTVSYDIEEPFDYLFVIDHGQAHYDHAISIAHRELKPVYLLKSQLQNNPRHQGSFKVLNWPFLQKHIAGLFVTSQAVTEHTHKPLTTNRSMHLLVLEDNVINQQLLLELLEKAGHVVDIFDDPQQALSAIDSNHYDALLVDYHLPNMTGIDFVLACRELGTQCTTVMMSADISTELKQRCQQHQIDKLIIKPFKIDDLMQLLSD
ncbi:ATP-binding protein [Marinicella gelatinilytica]|uniref:ATP-binding protein n=1 Tax=Marinicella gelatinilytica TaxID=2996017 RepID=UPI002260D7EA|nr:ATP-binding protein [Marinicella gelatinilytica]MCX7545878.1 ATP-binding protein [Marinicella gelatinilytica]